MNRVTVISPHQDDACLSLAVTVGLLTEHGYAVTVLNCFTETDYAPYAPCTSAGGVRELRRAEDREFLKGLGCRVSVVDLGFRDAPLRLGTAVRYVRNRKSLKSDRPQILALRTRITQLAADDVLLVPLSVGSHVDHRVALHASFGASRRKLYGFYEDLPYAAELRQCHTRAAVVEASRLCGRSLHPVIAGTPAALAQKRRLVSVYRSQLCRSQIDTVISYGTRMLGERLWLSFELKQEFVARRIAAPSGGPLLPWWLFLPWEASRCAADRGLRLARRSLERLGWHSAAAETSDTVTWSH